MSRFRSPFRDWLQTALMREWKLFNEEIDQVIDCEANLTTFKRAVEWQAGSKVYRIVAAAGYVEVLLPNGQIFQISELEAHSLVEGLLQVLPTRRMSQAVNAGQPWSAELDSELRDLWQKGQPLRYIASHFGRSIGAVESRAERLGLIARS